MDRQAQPTDHASSAMRRADIANGEGDGSDSGTVAPSPSRTRRSTRVPRPVATPSPDVHDEAKEGQR